MKLAIMQPYFFPYIGYFQLVNAADNFIFYDDVNFIKNGWINRNRISISGQVHYFTIPITEASSFKKINEIGTDPIKLIKWKEKFLKSLNQNYNKSPFYKETLILIEELLNQHHESVSDIAKNSVISVFKYLGLNKNLLSSTGRYENQNLKGEDRIIDICKNENASQYINAEGGTELYNKEKFRKNGIELVFLKTKDIEYSQFTGDFVPRLSIIDVMMFNSPAEISNLLNEYELI